MANKRRNNQPKDPEELRSPADDDLLSEQLHEILDEDLDDDAGADSTDEDL